MYAYNHVTKCRWHWNIDEFIQDFMTRVNYTADWYESGLSYTNTHDATNLSPVHHKPVFLGDCTIRQLQLICHHIHFVLSRNSFHLVFEECGEVRTLFDMLLFCIEGKTKQAWLKNISVIGVCIIRLNYLFIYLFI